MATRFSAFFSKLLPAILQRWSIYLPEGFPLHAADSQFPHLTTSTITVIGSMEYVAEPFLL